MKYFRYIMAELTTKYNCSSQSFPTITLKDIDKLILMSAI